MDHKEVIHKLVDTTHLINELHSLSALNTSWTHLLKESTCLT